MVSWQTRIKVIRPAFSEYQPMCGDNAFRKWQRTSNETLVSRARRNSPLCLESLNHSDKRCIFLVRCFREWIFSSENDGDQFENHFEEHESNNIIILKASLNRESSSILDKCLGKLDNFLPGIAKVKDTSNLGKIILLQQMIIESFYRSEMSVDTLNRVRLFAYYARNSSRKAS